MGKVIAVCTSEAKGTQKVSVPEIEIKEDWGIQGDAHAGKWHRQVSLLSVDEIEDVRSLRKWESASCRNRVFLQEFFTEELSVREMN